MAFKSMWHPFLHYCKRDTKDTLDPESFRLLALLFTHTAETLPRPELGPRLPSCALNNNPEQAEKYNGCNPTCCILDASPTRGPFPEGNKHQRRPQSPHLIRASSNSRTVQIVHVGFWDRGMTRLRTHRTPDFHANQHILLWPRLP